MAAFDNLKKLFSPDDRTRALPDDAFIVIDRERTVAKLRLEERAKEHGERNFPPPDAESRDDVEEEIIAEIQEHANRSRINASNTHRVYNERLSELALLRELSTITGASVQAQGDFRTTVISRQGRLALAKEAVRDSYRELAEFRKAHGLNRPAHDGIGSIYGISTVALSWLAESAINTPLLHVNDDMGYLGGFLIAAVVAALNVFPSALVGRYWWPYLSYKRSGPKMLAALGCVLWLVLLAVWNLLAGHFRDAKASGVANPETEALRLLAERPWVLDSMYSYGLLVAGVTFALLAATAAYKMKDPYPGYGDIYRRHQDRCDAYSDEIEYSLDELKDTRDEAIESAESIRDELRRQFSERGQIIAAREGHRGRFREHLEYVESVAQYLLSYYRAANTRSRSDGQMPAHFRSAWSLGRTDLPQSEEPSIESEVLRAQNALSGSITTVASTYVEAVESFEHLDKIKESLANA